MPSFVSRILALCRNLFRRTVVEQELSAELAQAFEFLVETKIRDGTSTSEARRLAAIELGGVEQLKEEIREFRAGYNLEGLFRDVRYGVANAAEESGLYRRRHHCARARHRREYRHLQPGERRSSPSASVSGRRTHRLHRRQRILRRALPTATSRISTSPIGRNKPISSRAPRPTGPASADLGARRSGTGARAARRCDDRVLLRARGPACSRASVRSRRRQTSDIQRRPDVAIISHGLWKRRFGSDPAIVGKQVQMKLKASHGHWRDAAGV